MCTLCEQGFSPVWTMRRPFLQCRSHILKCSSFPPGCKWRCSYFLALKTSSCLHTVHWYVSNCPFWQMRISCCSIVWVSLGVWTVKNIMHIEKYLMQSTSLSQICTLSYITKTKSRFALSFTEPQNQRFRLKNDCFLVQNPRKGIVFKLGLARYEICDLDLWPHLLPWLWNFQGQISK